MKGPVPREASSQKLVISKMREKNALIHSELLVLDTENFSHFMARHENFVCVGCKFLCARKKKQKIWIRNNGNGSWIPSLSGKFPCCHNFSTKAKRKISLWCKCLWMTEQTKLLAFCVDAWCWSLPARFRALLTSMLVLFLSKQRQRKKDIKYCYDICERR